MAVKEFEYEYNPVKELKGGEQSAKVVWSTKSLNMAVDAIKKGLPLKTNPFCGTNTLLLKPDLVYKRTPEELEDYMKCMQDPVYFASKCYLMTPEGLQPCKLRDYQVDYLRHLQKNRFSVFLSCRQSGKSTTTAIYCLWTILFNTDKQGLILSKSGPAGQDLLSKTKDAICAFCDIFWHSQKTLAIFLAVSISSCTCAESSSTEPNLRSARKNESSSTSTVLP
jgi:hypothetical protein